MCTEEWEREVVTRYYGAHEYQLGTVTHRAHGAAPTTHSIYHFLRCCPLARGLRRPGIVDVSPCHVRAVAVLMSSS